jgi:hypothetical protein
VSSASAWQTIIGSTAVAVLLYVQSWIGKRAQDRRHAENVKKLNTTIVKLDEVEKTVDGNFDKALARIDQLAAALTAHGIDVPPTPAQEET